MYRSRILKEATEAGKNRDKHVILYMKEDNIFRWKAYIMGPDDTPYKDGVFELKITLTAEYPIKPPNIVFVTRIFHPNIHFESVIIIFQRNKKKKKTYFFFFFIDV